MTRQSRVDALDNLRTLMVLFILLLHAACAYAVSIPWWHARDRTSQGFDLLMFSIDAFALPVLFFVSGLFAGPSCERHGRTGFLLRKLRHFGIPLVLLSAFYLPAMVYVGYLRRAATPVSFFAYWQHWMTSLTDWHFNLLTSMETAARFQDAFSPHHLWFVSMLLIFFTGYALCRPLTSGADTRGVGRATLVWTWVILAVGYSAVNLLIQDWAWARIGPFILFQPTRVPLYLGAFLFGIVARPHVARHQSLPGSPYLWAVIFAFLLIATLATSGKTPPTRPALLHEAVVAGLLRGGLVLSAVCLTINSSFRLLRHASGWQRSLNDSSYDLYILHMPLVVFVQAALLETTFPLMVKMLLAFSLPAALCWGVSRQVLARLPGLGALGLLLTFFAGFCICF